MTAKAFCHKTRLIKDLLGACRDLSNHLKMHPSMTGIWTQHRGMASRKKQNVRKEQDTKVKKKKVVQFEPPSLSYFDITANFQVGEVLGMKPLTDVWVSHLYPPQLFEFEDVLQNFKDLSDSSMLNTGHCHVQCRLSASAYTKKQGKFISVNNLLKMSSLPHAFDPSQELKILAFCSDLEQVEFANENGATHAGLFQDLLNQVIDKDIKIDDFDVVISSTLMDVGKYRALFGTSFPSESRGTMGPDLEKLLSSVQNSIHIKSEPTSKNGIFEIVFPIGQLHMPVSSLMENFNFIIDKINQSRPKKMPGAFLLSLELMAPPYEQPVFVNPAPHDIGAEADNAEVKSPSGQDAHEEAKEAEA